MNILNRQFFMVLLSLVSFCLGGLELSGISPGSHKIDEPVTITAVRDVAADTLTIVLTLHMKKEIHLYSAESLFFRLAVDSVAGLEGGSIHLPVPHPYTNFDSTHVDVFIDGQSFVIKQRIGAPKWKISATMQFQACDQRMCFTPRRLSVIVSSDGDVVVLPTGSSILQPNTDVSLTDSSAGFLLGEFGIKGSRGGFIPVEEFSQFLEDPSKNSPGGMNAFENHGLMVVIVLILLGGIALNLTPCVLPMIPITIAVIGAGAQAGSRARGMFIGGVYGMAMAFTYGILGLAVVLTGTRFGVINSSPVFNFAIAGIFIVMALAMFDIIVIDFTRFRKPGTTSGDRGKVVTVFIMGCIAALLAGACVAPVVIAVVLYAGSMYAQGNSAGLLLPLLLGVGMALPWPFAGAGLSLLPKPGKWMVWVKYVFGVFIIIMALYYGVIGVKLIRSMQPVQKVEESVGVSASTGIAWETDLEKGIEKAKSEKKPLFIDCWATWCKNCKAMDATTLRDPKVTELLTNYICVKYQAEHPDAPETKQVLDYLNVVGLPAYVILEYNERK